MKTSAHIIKETILGTVNFQVNVIDPLTGKCYNNQSKRFRTKKEAVQFAEQNGLSIKKEIND